jgi:hypothetical protein
MSLYIVVCFCLLNRISQNRMVPSMAPEAASACVWHLHNQMAYRPIDGHILGLLLSNGSDACTAMHRLPLQTADVLTIHQ